MKILLLLLVCFNLYGCTTTNNLLQIRQDYVDSRSDLSSKQKNDILNGAVLIGMSINDVNTLRPDCYYAFKYPESISTTAFGTSKTCICSDTYFNFVNDELVSVNYYE
jgi:hypothetical protein